MPNYLQPNEISELLDNESCDVFSVERVRPHNKGEIRKVESMTLWELKGFIFESIEDEHQPGGDLIVTLPKAAKKLIGHHDALYWLEN